jgi:hypothetical protein
MHRTLVVLLCAAAPAQAFAQDDFSRLALKPGQVIFVTDSTDTIVSGVASQASASELTVDGRRFTPATVLKIERKGDSVWNGAAIGFAAGAASGLTIGAEACADSSKWRCVVGGGVTLGAIGALIDWARTGRTTIYDRRLRKVGRAGWSVVPSITPHIQSVAVVIGSDPSASSTSRSRDR